MSKAAPTASRVFSTIAPGYDRMKSFLSFGREVAWKKRAAERMLTGAVGLGLDLATGTGDLLAILLDAGRWPEARYVAVDFCPRMLALARERIRSERVGWLVADLNRVPFPAGTFDLITVGYGMRYATDLPRFFARCHELLKPGGRFFAFDVGLPRSRVLRRIWPSYLFAVGTLLGLALHARPTAYWHLAESLGRYPGQDAVVRSLLAAGFRTAEVQDVMLGTLAAHVAIKA